MKSHRKIPYVLLEALRHWVVIKETAWENYKFPQTKPLTPDWITHTSNIRGWAITPNNASQWSQWRWLVFPSECWLHSYVQFVKTHHYEHFSVGPSYFMTHEGLHVLLPTTSPTSLLTTQSSNTGLLSTPWPHTTKFPISTLVLIKSLPSRFIKMCYSIPQRLISDDTSSEKSVFAHPC